MTYKVKIKGKWFTGMGKNDKERRKDAERLVARYGGKLYIIPVAR